MKNLKFIVGLLLLPACASVEGTHSPGAGTENPPPARTSEAVRKLDEQIGDVDGKIGAVQGELTAAESRRNDPGTPAPIQEKTEASLRRELSTLKAQRAYLQSQRNHALLNTGTARQ
jgi:hypothetical protein